MALQDELEAKALELEAREQELKREVRSLSVELEQVQKAREAAATLLGINEESAVEPEGSARPAAPGARRRQASNEDVVDVAEAVLREAGRPLAIGQLLEAMRSDPRIPDDWSTSNVIAHLRRRADRFTWAGAGSSLPKGQYGLREWGDEA